MQWCTPITPAHGRQRHEDHHQLVKASLVYGESYRASQGCSGRRLSIRKEQMNETDLPFTGAPSIISYLAIVSVSVVVLGPSITAEMTLTLTFPEVNLCPVSADYCSATLCSAGHSLLRLFYSYHSAACLSPHR